LPLCAIKRVERLSSSQSTFELAITTWNGLDSTFHQPSAADGVLKFTLQLNGSRQACDRFCDGLKKGLREGMKHIDNLRAVVATCYSEYLLSVDPKKTKEGPRSDRKPQEPPDAGLGMMFRYPGDARLLRDRSKMRLWGEYLRRMGYSLPAA